MRIFILYIFSCVSFTSFNNASAQDTIHWRANYKLQWEDFQGIPDTSSEYKAISSPAINYTLSYNETSYSCKVSCFFKKRKSWISEKDTSLINHEQGHFDIAELFARKFRKRIKDYRFDYSTVNQDIGRIFRSMIQERGKIDSFYDKETNFSRNKIKQIYRNKKIITELEKLEAYVE